jgi:hypothetical protein
MEEKGQVSKRVWQLGYGLSGLAGISYVALTYGMSPQESVLHRSNPIQVWLGWWASPYPNILTAFLGVVAISVALLFNFRKFSGWRAAILFFLLGACFATLVFSILALNTRS